MLDSVSQLHSITENMELNKIKRTMLGVNYNSPNIILYRTSHVTRIIAVRMMEKYTWCSKNISVTLGYTYNYKLNNPDLIKMQTAKYVNKNPVI